MDHQANDCDSENDFALTNEHQKNVKSKSESDKESASTRNLDKIILSLKYFLIIIKILFGKNIHCTF